MNHIPYTLRYFYSEMWKFRGLYGTYVLMLTCSVISGGIIIPLLLKDFIDVFLANLDDAVRLRLLLGNLKLIGLWTGIFIASRMVANLSVNRVLPYVAKSITDNAFAKFLILSYSYFASTFIGGTVAKVKRASDSLIDVEFHLTRGLFETLIHFVAAISVIYSFSVILGTIFMLWGVLFVLMMRLLLRFKMKADMRVSEADSEVSSALADSITNVLTIKMFARGVEEHEQFQNVSDKKARILHHSWTISALIEFLQELSTAAVQIIVLFLCISLWRQGSMTVGTVVLVQMYLMMISRQLIAVGTNMKSLQRSLARCGELVDVMRQVPTIQDPTTPEKIHMDHGHIVFDTVGFSYTNESMESTDALENAVFKDFSLNIPASQKVGVVGHSGGGKSTLTKLLLRFLDVQEGSISIDSQDIRNVTQDDLRSCISYVPQEPILFHRSVYDNIAYGNPTASKEEVMDAARRAHAHEFIESLPSGYDTFVGERGVKLSGGERQRIAIARVMLENAPILILDEATSSLDSLSEKYIQESFEDLSQGRTTIVIAHRLSTIRKLDRIVLIDNGEVKEDGTHDELLELGGLYAKLYEQQHDGFM